MSVDQIDYAEGIDCPENYSDERMLNEFVIRDDHELLYLDSYLKETMGNLTGAVEKDTIGA